MGSIVMDRIAELESQLEQTQRDLSATRIHEKAIRLDERQKTADAINRAMDNGAKGCAYGVPDDNNWLAPYWILGREKAVQAKQLNRAAEHRKELANDFDATLEELRPAMELILANREYFGAKIGERLVPVLTDFFLKAYAQAPADEKTEPKNFGGHELVHFVRGVQAIAPNGTHVGVATTEDGSGYAIRLTSHKGLETEYTTELAIKAGTLEVVLELIVHLTGLRLPHFGRPLVINHG
jgi:hypothetical protein